MCLKDLYHITGAASSATDKSSSTPTPTDDDGGGQFLRLPKALHDQDASLETIDLNDDPNDQTLERFLRGKTCSRKMNLYSDTLFSNLIGIFCSSINLYSS